MIYKLHNKSEKEFSFEGVVIAPNAVSEELPLLVYQRLLALYFHQPLYPVAEVAAPSAPASNGPVEGTVVVPAEDGGPVAIPLEKIEEVKVVKKGRPKKNV